LGGGIKANQSRKARRFPRPKNHDLHRSKIPCGV
jgi:hypothetical protein